MKSNQRGAAWPYLFILMGLFALSITAPRAWNRQRYVGPAMEALLVEQPSADAAPAAVCPTKDADPTEMSEKADDASACIDPGVSAVRFSGMSIGPVVVAPLREFGRRVIDPIVEFARRPTELRALPDLFFPKFEPEDKADASSSKWSLPETLLESLERLSEHAEAAEWATGVSRQIRELHKPNGLRPATDILKDLRETADRAPTLRDSLVQVNLERAHYALARRLEVWDCVLRVEAMHIDDSREPAINDPAADERVTRCLEDVERLTAMVSSGDAWHAYLLVDQVRSLGQASQGLQRKREVAREVLARLQNHRLSPQQRQFVARQQIVTLATELHKWAAEPVAVAQLLGHLERYERTQLAADARLLAADGRSLQWTADRSLQALGECVDLHYRNANLRLAVSPAFVNRFVPQPTATNARVSDTILGVPVRGNSTTFTRVRVEPIPDPHRIRLGLEADGSVASNTTSDAGPATFHNRAASNFLVRKLLLLGPTGMRVWPAIADVDSSYSNLTDVETDFDIVPLVGPLVRNLARSQHAEALPDARREMDAKVASRARRRLDEESQLRLESLNRKVDAQVLEPLRQLGLEPIAMDMCTTEDRLTTRMRLAGDGQLGAHTPRPRAPSDSLASLQLHQSAINNLLEALDLGGREFAVPELYAWIGRKLARELQAPEDVPDDVVVKFAESNAVRVRCVDGHLELAIGIAKLSHGKKRWRDFVVKTTYEPDRTSRETRFVRSGGIFLEGKSLQGRAEFVLRSIMSKALSVDRPWRIVPEKLAADERIADLEITQFVVEDGWIGVAYAPKRVPSQIARKPR